MKVNTKGAATCCSAVPVKRYTSVPASAGRKSPGWTWPTPCSRLLPSPAVAYPSQLKAGALFISPWKAGQHASPEELQDLVDDLQKHTACAIAWYFPYAYRKLHNELGQYFPGWRCCSSRLEATSARAGAGTR